MYGHDTGRCGGASMHRIKEHPMHDVKNRRRTSGSSAAKRGKHRIIVSVCGRVDVQGAIRALRGEAGDRQGIAFRSDAFHSRLRGEGPGSAPALWAVKKRASDLHRGLSRNTSTGASAALRRAMCHPSSSPASAAHLPGTKRRQSSGRGRSHSDRSAVVAGEAAERTAGQNTD